MEFGATCGSPLLNHSLQHGYLVKPLTVECNSDIGGESAVGDLVLHVRSDEGVTLNKESVSSIRLSDLLKDVYRTRRSKVLFLDFADELVPARRG
jgi:hypothetical protein